MIMVPPNIHEAPLNVTVILYTVADDRQLRRSLQLLCSQDRRDSAAECSILMLLAAFDRFRK
jgi:hypothetical protein